MTQEGESMSRDIITKHVEFSDEALQEKRNADGKLLFTKVEDKNCAAWVNGGRLRAFQVLTEQSGRIGAFYIAKVRKVVPNLNACFVEIAGGEICFLPLREARHFFRCSQISANRKNNGLCQGDEILVQIIKEAQKNKQATVTAHVSLTNEACVISIGTNKVGYSTKLTKEEKSRFKALLEREGYVKSGVFCVPEQIAAEYKSYILDTIAETGMVVRTVAAQLDEESFLTALQKLLKEYLELLITARHRICFSCVKEPLPAFAAVIDRMVYDYEYSEIVTDDEALYGKLTDYAATRLQEKNVRLYKDEMLSLEKLYSIGTKVKEALQTKVWLKSGAYIVIEHTEAMTVIDVNSGKFEASAGAKDTELLINQEAAEEIALQVRLRNLSGIIVIDFINMEKDSQKEELLSTLRTAASSDKQKCMVVDITPLGLVEMTRRKDSKPLNEQLLPDNGVQ